MKYDEKLAKSTKEIVVSELRRAPYFRRWLKDYLAETLQIQMIDFDVNRHKGMRFTIGLDMKITEANSIFYGFDIYLVALDNSRGV